MPWPKKKSDAPKSAPPDDQKKQELPTPATIAIMLAAIVVIGVGLWLLVG